MRCPQTASCSFSVSSTARGLEVRLEVSSCPVQREVNKHGHDLQRLVHYVPGVIVGVIVG